MTLISEQDYADWRLANNIINLIICIVFLILYIRGFKSLSKPIAPVMKWISLIYVIFYTLRYLIHVILIIIISYYYNSTRLIKIDGTFGDIGFIAAHSVFYFLMFARLYYGFKGSVLELSNIVTYGYIISQLLIVGINSFYFTRKHGNGQSIVLIILVICDILLGGFLIYSFTRRLFKLIIMQRDESSSKSIEINDNQKLIINTITKYTLLCSLGIIFRDFQFFASSIIGLINYNKDTLIIKLIFKYWWTLVLFIELFTVYLSFNFAKDQYKKVCSFCDSRVKSTCNAIAANQINKQIMNDTGEVDLAYQKL